MKRSINVFVQPCKLIHIHTHTHTYTYNIRNHVPFNFLELSSKTTKIQVCSLFMFLIIFIFWRLFVSLFINQNFSMHFVKSLGLFLDKSSTPCPGEPFVLKDPVCFFVRKILKPSCNFFKNCHQLLTALSFPTSFVQGSLFLSMINCCIEKISFFFLKKRPVRKGISDLSLWEKGELIFPEGFL